MRRRQALQTLGAAVFGWQLSTRFATAAEDRAREKILFFSRSVLFEHPVIRREGGELSYAERVAPRANEYPRA